MSLQLEPAFLRRWLSRFGLLLMLVSVRGVYSQPTTQPPDEETPFRVLTWNVYMLPRILTRAATAPRVREISQILRRGRWDVVVLQEVFTRRAFRLLREGLKPVYPHVYRPSGAARGLRLRSGVVIFSRHPIVRKRFTAFDASGCKGADCWSRKGAAFVEVAWRGERVQVIGTHMQSLSEDAEAHDIRLRQAARIRQFLLSPTARKGVPQILVGDFNVRRDGTPEVYACLLDTLHLQNVDSTHTSPPTYDGPANTLARGSNGYNEAGNREVIDYIFQHPRGTDLRCTSFGMKRWQRPWRGPQPDDLSDHFALEASFVW